HDIAVVKVPENEPVGSSSLAHTALEIEGGVPELKELYQKLKAYGTDAEFTFDHIITKSLYFRDPDGNRLELFCQEVPAQPAMEMLRGAANLGDVLLPLDLETSATA